MRRPVLFSVTAFLGAVLVTAPAHADYMSECDDLIGAWNRCQQSGGDCSLQRQAIEEKCVCHRFQGGQWRLVNAAVGADGVCEANWPEDTPPIVEDPVPPRGSSVVQGEGEVRHPKGGRN